MITKLLRTFVPTVALLASLCAVEAAEFERLKYNNPGLTVDLGVGLWAWPLPIDYDKDGDLDLVVSCPDFPSGGTYFFENPGGDVFPVFKPAVKIGPKLKNVALSHVDGKPRVLTPGREHTGILQGDFSASKKVYPRTTLLGGGRVRANQWSYTDYDADGKLDLIVGHGFWGDYGWDDAFDSAGNWTRGPLHGFVFLLRNNGMSEEPGYEKPVKVEAGGEPVDVYGMPSPCFADFDGDDDLDLLCGDFIDGFTYFENTGSRTEPRYAKGRPLASGDKLIEMPLCMIVVEAVDWDRDGDTDLVVGQEDGRVALIEHTGEVDSGMPVFREPRFFQQQAENVKFGALVTPVSYDWDGDGDEDLICGNTTGEIGFIENLGGKPKPRWAAPQLLEVKGQPIRITAGMNGSIQGPAEQKWGYTTLDVADWDHDGLADLVVNSIWGKVVWYRNVGTRKNPQLAAAAPITVQWSGTPPKPAWNWWDPKPGELATQWRTTPQVVDWNGDGLNDLVMLDHQGYLALFRRVRSGDRLTLLPGERLFVDEEGSPLRLNSGSAGKSGRRKLCIVDFDGDGRRDLLVNSKNADFYRNEGEKDGRVTVVNQGAVADDRLAGHTTSPTTVDFNGDDRRELLVGAEDGYLYHLAGRDGSSATSSKSTSSNQSARGTNRKAARASKAVPKAEKDKARPNILFIAVDDLRIELGCYGDTIVKSPNIDKLAARGTRFNHAYCQQAVCNPSRASLMTGLRPDTINVWSLPVHFREHRPKVVTLPQLFKQNGYHAQDIGKIYHNSRQEDYQGDPESWSVPAVMHYGTHGADKPIVEGKLPPDHSNVPRTEMRDVPDDAYFDGRIANLAIEALRELKDDQFFLAVGFWKPHADFNAPKKYWDLYDRDEISPPENPTPPVNVPSLAMHDAREIRRAFTDRPGNKPTAEDTLALRHGYYAATSFVDAQVGKVVDELDHLGLADNTIIVFWSDHGYHLGEHALWAKTSNFELDARVPMIIATPWHKKGQVADAPVELLDIYPTLAALCGLDPPNELEGKSLRPMLEDPTTHVKAFAMTQHPRPAYPRRDDPEAMGYSIRNDRHRYTEWRDFKSGEVRAVELYDHNEDPRETANVADEPKNAKLVKRLAAEMEKAIAGKVATKPEQ